MNPIRGFQTWPRDEIRHVVRQSWSGRVSIMEIHSAFGANVAILAGITIGNRAVVGAGSIVTRDVPPADIVAGNPTRPLRQIPAAAAPN